MWLVLPFSAAAAAVAPAITAQPTNQTVLAGASAQFVAAASGTAPSYHWYFKGAVLTNGGSISGADTLTLSIANAQPAAAGNYFLVASNVAGVATSSNASLSVVAFTGSSAGLTNPGWAMATWADYDGDGDLDLLCTGPPNVPRTSLFRNDGNGVFTSVSTSLPDLSGPTAWGDYDNDGKPDLALSGTWPGPGPSAIARIYHNDGGGVFSLAAELRHVQGVVAWADFNGDGKPDLVLSGPGEAYLYLNNGDGTFSETDPGLEGVGFGAAACADFDNDGNMDLLLSGIAVDSSSKTHLYRGDGQGHFTESGIALSGRFATWGDYNNDGWLDILQGDSGAIYRNNGGASFTLVTNQISTLDWPCGGWGDFDNDGRPDFLRTGSDNGYPVADLFHNAGNDAFPNTGMFVPGLVTGGIAWGDYDNDGRLDFVELGYSYDLASIAVLFHNDGALPNVVPTPPANLAVNFSPHAATLTWTAATDTNQGGGLSYNVRIGTSPGAVNVAAPLADPVTGYRRIPALGNASLRLNYTLKNPTPGTYYWSVQAIDAAYAGSGFAAEQSFTIALPVITNQPKSVLATIGATASFTVGATGALGFQWYFNGAALADSADITGSTTTNLNLSNIQNSELGNYTVVATNYFGAVTSVVASLALPAPPAITLQPTNRAVNLGGSAQFRSGASGAPAPSYQWYLNGAALSDDPRVTGSTSALLSVAPAQTNDAGNYWMVASNSQGSATSVVATLSVRVPPAIITQPTNQTVQLGGNATFTIVASGTAPLIYHWRKGGVNLTNNARISSTTNATLTIAGVLLNDAGNYSLAASNTAGALTSAVAVLTVTLPPCAITASNLVSWWPGENSMVDATGRNSGTNAGFGTFGYGAGMVGQAFVFDGIHRDRVDLGNPTNLQLQDFTLEAWVKRTDAADISLDDSTADGSQSGEGGGVISYGRGGYGMGLVNNGRVYLSRIDIDGVFSTNVVADLNWHHIAATKSGTTVMLYIDGATAAAPITYASTFTFDTSAAIGSRGDARGGTFYGMVDEPAVYSRALTTAEILGIYNFGSQGKCPLAAAMLTQPTNATVFIGATATLRAATGGTPPLWHQWYFKGTALGNGGPVSGADTPVLIIANAQTNNTGSYWLIVTNATGAATSSVATLNVVVQPPAITQGPTNQTRNMGDSAAFSVTASGTPPLTYQWYFNGGRMADDARVAGSLAAALAISPVGPGDAGNYWVVATNAAGSVTSAVATLTVIVPPTITVQPTNQSVLLNSNALFSVAASGSSPLIYRWRFGGVDLSDGGRVSGASSSTLTIAGALLGDAGDYAVTVTNAAGGTTSAVATLTVVVVPPTITAPPQSQTNVAGTTANFSAAASGSAPLQYQWQFNGENLAGATNASLALASVQPPDAGNYAVVVANIGGSVTSEVAVLTVVVVPPNITAQPLSQTNVVGTPASFSVTVTGSTPLHYQWLFNGTNLAGATDAGFALANAQATNAGNYSAVITNLGGAATSDVAVLTLILPPCAGTVSNLVSWWQGENLTFDVMGRNNGTVTGTGTFGYGPGVVGQAFVFDGTHRDRVDMGNPTNLQLQDFTLEAWVKRSSATDISLDDKNADGSQSGEGGAVIAYGRGGYSMGLLNDGRLFLSRIDFDGPVSTLLVADLNWHHIAVTKAGTNVVLYIDGTPAAAPINYTSTFTFDTSIAVGSRGDARGGTFFGMVDEPAVFSRALSGAEIQAIYSASFIGKCPPQAEPKFAAQPVDRRVVLGQPTTFTAAATGALPFSYRWQKDSVDIPGGTNNTLQLTAVAALDLGSYHLMASNAYGVAISSNAMLASGNIVVWGRNDAGQALVPFSATNVVAISAGGNGSGASHTLGLRADGSVVAWGNNANGQCNVPADLGNIVAVAAGGTHSLALRSDGTVLAWGDNSSGQTNVPGTLSNVVGIAAGGFHSLALRADGKVFAWGRSTSTNVPGGVTKAVAIAAGATNSVAVRVDGTVIEWPGIVTNGVPDPRAVAVGGAHGVMARGDGSVRAWGANNFGQAIPPTGLTNVTAVAAGDFFSLALRNDGGVSAWGRNEYGQTNLPAAISSAVAVAAGGAHGVALLGDGTPLITHQPVGGTSFVGRDFSFQAAVSGAGPLTQNWQMNGADIPDATNVTLVVPNLSSANAGSYQLIASNAQGVAVSVPAPLTVLDDTNLTLLSQPASIQTNYQGAKVILSVSAAGNGPVTYQWQYNGAPVAGGTGAELFFDPILATNTGSYTVLVGNINTTLSSGISTQRVRVAKVWGTFFTDPPFTVTNAVAVAAGHAGQSHYVALRSDGKISGWGTSSFGESSPPPSLSNSVVTDIAAGYQDSLALRSDGTVFAWGNNSFGQSNVPPAATGVVAIACGDYHLLALKSNGTVIAWGRNNSGQTNVPAALTNAVAVAGGGSHSLALQADGRVTGWGFNGSGQLNIPASATNGIAIAGGGSHSVMLRADGTVVQWGYSAAGPVPAGLSNVASISAGFLHSTAVREDGSLVTWGNYEQFNGAPVPTDLANLIQVSGGSDGDVGLFGTRAPVVTVNPFSRRVARGSNTVMVAKAAGVQPVTYQWQFNGAGIAGATSSALALTGLQFEQGGAYQMVASNRYGVATSKPANLIVKPLASDLPAITSHPVGQTTNAGATVQFRVTATGFSPMVYQWRRNGTNYDGANESVLTLLGVSRSNNGAYSVAVSNAAGSVVSSNAVLKVLVPQKFGPPLLLSNGGIVFVSGDADGGTLGAGDVSGFTALGSTDLVNWVTLPGALSVTNGMLLLQDLGQTNYPTRFYRILEQ